MKPLDIQVNGYAGTDFNRDDLTAEALHHACTCLLEDGCDQILATFITDTVPNLEKRMSRLVELRAQAMQDWAAQHPGTPQRHLVFAPAKYLSNAQLRTHGIEFAALPFVLFRQG